MKNSVKSAQNQVTLVRIMEIHNHFFLDSEHQCGPVCLWYGLI